jgi:hypothetical protein
LFTALWTSSWRKCLLQPRMSHAAWQDYNLCHPCPPKCQLFIARSLFYSHVNIRSKFTSEFMQSSCYNSLYVVSPKRNRTFEIARQWAGAGRLRRWCCVVGTLSLIFTLATSRHFN